MSNLNIPAGAFTVAELIKKLAILPENLPVVLEGYEGGYNHCLSFETLELALNVYNEDYYGNHEQPELLSEKQKTQEYALQNALVIRGGRSNA